LCFDLEKLVILGIYILSRLTFDIISIILYIEGLSWEKGGGKEKVILYYQINSKDLEEKIGRGFIKLSDYKL